MSGRRRADAMAAIGFAAEKAKGPERVLVIRLGALGDLIQCFDAFQDIRRHHPDAAITLLTGTPFVGFAASMPWFDDVWGDPRGRGPLAYWRVRRRLRAGRFTRVYDLQNKARTARYRWLMGLGGGARPLWSGDAPGADFPRPDIDAHNRQRYRAQLAAAGVPDSGGAETDWLAGGIGGLVPDVPFVLLIPGCSPHLPHKRWPPASYADLGRRLLGRGLLPVIVGTRADRDAADGILADCPDAVDLVGRTDLGQLAALARAARGAVGNDTGPVFLTAVVGCPTLMLMSHHTNPARSAPAGPDAGWLKRPDLADLTVAEVMAALRLRPDAAPGDLSDAPAEAPPSPLRP